MSHHEKSEILLGLPTEMVSAFDRIAAILGRDRSGVMQQALADYLVQAGADVLNDANGLDELDRGESTDLDDVLETARAIVDAAEARRGTRVG
jgi:predicted transcriptional regulator